MSRICSRVKTLRHDNTGRFLALLSFGFLIDRPHVVGEHDPLPALRVNRLPWIPVQDRLEHPPAHPGRAERLLAGAEELGRLNQDMGRPVTCQLRQLSPEDGGIQLGPFADYRGRQRREINDGAIRVQRGHRAGDAVIDSNTDF